MKCTIPEISWHNRDPILSVDIQPTFNDEFYRLASGGTDCHVLIWHLKIRQNGAVDVEAVSDLSRHQRAVNVVRWSPTGFYLASGDDDANIIIWNLKTDNIPLLDGETGDKETWMVYKILRGHREDVYDLCWSPNETKLFSGSIDNTAILWDITKGASEHILSDHKGFVQGVTWDPKGDLIATLSSDRICRVFDSNGKHVRARAYKGCLPLAESHELFKKEIKYFHDDTFKSYFRRLCFSPDGNLLIAPSGCIESEEYKSVRHSTLMFTLDSLTQPAAILPSPKQVTVAVRCCPLLFELHPDGVDPVICLPYRMIVAVATDNDIILYDTQQLTPFAHLQKIHYTRITDLTWSSDGLLLIASSTDGYCTLVTFHENELGIQYVKEDSEAEISTLDLSGIEEIDKNSTLPVQKVKKPNILEKWAIKKDNKHAQIPPITNTKRRIVPIKVVENKKSKEKDNEVIDITISNSIVKEIKPIMDKKATPSRKRKTDKKNTPDKNSPLLKLFQGIKSTKKLNPTNVIEVSDEETEEAAISTINHFKKGHLELKIILEDLYANKKLKLSDIETETDEVLKNIETIKDTEKASPESLNTLTNEKENVTTEKIADATPTNVALPLGSKAPRRIALITLSSPKRKKL